MTPFRTLLFLAAALLLHPSESLAGGEAATRFQVFVPPNNDNVGRDVALVVTSLRDGTVIDVIDDDDDGDADDTALGVNLDFGQSFVRYLKEGSVNDDAGGKWDGDYFTILSNYPVTVHSATDSGWQHDFAPSTGRVSVGRQFIFYVGGNSGNLHDLNVFAYEDALVVVEDITTTAYPVDNLTNVSPLSPWTLLSLQMGVGEDLWVRHGLGSGMLQPGHTYMVRASGDVSVQHGALQGQARDGGGFVPARTGAPVGERFYFTIPSDHDHERELRIAAVDASEVRVFGWDAAQGEFIPFLEQSLQAGDRMDLVGDEIPGLRDHDLFKIETDGGRVSVFEANWLETGSIGTSDYASSVSDVNGHGAGERFVCYMGPPGTQTRVQGVAGTYAHLYVSAYEGDAVVRVTDLATGGEIVDQTATVTAGGFHDFRLDPADYFALTYGGGRPYLDVSVSNGYPVAVLNTNFNDNWLSYSYSVLPPTPQLSISAPSRAECEEDFLVQVEAVHTVVGSTLSDGVLEIDLPDGTTYVSSSGLGSPDSITTNPATGKTIVQWLDLSYAAGLEHAVAIVVHASCTSVPAEAPLPDDVVVDVSALASGISGSQTYGSMAHTNFILDRDGVTVISALAATAAVGQVDLSWQTLPESGTLRFEIRRSVTPDGQETTVGEVDAEGPSLGTPISYEFHDMVAGGSGPYYYRVAAIQDSGAVVVAGPVEVTVVPVAPPPTTDFVVTSRRHVSSAALGAVIVSDSGHYSSSTKTEKLIDGSSSTYWATANGYPQDQWVRIELVGASSTVIDRVRLRGVSSSWGLKDFEIYVSDTESDAAAFVPVFAGRVPRSSDIFEYRFSPVRAKYVELRILNNYGYSLYSGAYDFEVYSAGQDGSVVSMPAAGALIASHEGTVSPYSNLPTAALDAVVTSHWESDVNFPNQMTVDLAGGLRRVSAVELLAANTDMLVKDFSIEVSADGSDYEEVVSDTLPFVVGQYFRFEFEPVWARYVRLNVLSNRGHSSRTRVPEFRVHAMDANGLTVPFEDRSSPGTEGGHIVHRHWDFGDGATSTEEKPVHSYTTAGSYDVTLAVTDDSGQTASEAMTIQVRAPLDAGFGVSPSPSNINSSVSVSANTTSGVIARRWRSQTLNWVSQSSASFSAYYASTPLIDRLEHYMWDAYFLESYTSITHAVRNGSGDTPPRIVSSPVLLIPPNHSYSYDVDAVDGKTDDVLTFSLDEAPSGMTINGSTGVVSWSPAVANLGEHRVTVRVTDLASQYDTQSFFVRVKLDGAAPLITSSAITTVTAEVPYAYQLVVEDPDVGETFTYSVEEGPAGLTVSVTGLVTWNPDASDVGAHSVVLRATDSTGASDEQSYTLTVAALPGPTAAFQLSRGRNAAAYGDGARVLEASGDTSGANALLTSAHPRWNANVGAGAFVRLELAEQAHVLGRLVVQSVGSPAGIKAFELAVSRTGSELEDFQVVFAGELPFGDAVHSIELGAVVARYVEFRVVSTQGASSQAAFERLELWERPRDVALASVYERGATIVSASSGASSAHRAIDFSDSTVWTPSASLPQDVVIQLAPGGPVTLEGIELRPNAGANALSSFDLYLSDSGTDSEDFELVVFEGECTDPTGGCRFYFEPTSAVYAKLVAQTTVGGGLLSFTGLRLLAADRGEREVPFDNLSTPLFLPGPGPELSHHWDFGDGSRSTERDPVHRFPSAGTYTVTLVVTDTYARSSTATMSYTVLSESVALIDADPDPGVESGYVTLSDASIHYAAPGVARAWTLDGADWGQNASFNAWFNDSGWHESTLEVVNGDGIRSSTRRRFRVLNLDPTISSTAPAELVWGQNWTPEIYASDPSIIDRQSLLCDIDYGDETLEVVPDCHGGGNELAAVVMGHAYAYPGVYRPVLGVSDKDGGFAQLELEVAVGKRPVGLFVDASTITVGAGEVAVRARLVDAFDPQASMAGKTIRLSSPLESFPLTTNADGWVVAVLTVSGSLASVEARFDGDVFYESALSRDLAIRDGDLTAIGAGIDDASNLGREFWIALPRNYTVTSPYGFEHALFIAAEASTTVLVDLPGAGEQVLYAGAVGPNLPARVLLSDAMELEEKQVETQKTIRVRSGDRVAVQLLSYETAVVDSTLVFPRRFLGQDHYVFTNGAGATPSVIAPVGASLTITPSWTVHDRTGIVRPAGVPFGELLPTAGSLQLLGLGGVGADLTGTRIQSNAPVAVLGAHPCAFVPVPEWPCDALLEQLPAVPHWGTDAVLIPVAGRPAESKSYRVLAAEDDTDVTLDGAALVTLDAGEWHSFETETDFAYLSADKPIQVVLYQKGKTRGQVWHAAQGLLGDPFLQLIPPTGQHLNTQLLVQPLNAALPWIHHHIVIVVPTAGQSQVTLDGEALSATWQTIGTSGFSGTVVETQAGTHRISTLTGTTALMAYAQGLAGAQSYGHLGGLAFRDLSEPCSTSTTTPGDALDNDCDGVFDEELANGIDDDGDGLIDEDLRFGPGHNVAPVAYDGLVQLREGTRARVLVHARDENLDPLTYDLVTPPSHGVLSGTLPVVTYTPDDSFVGTDEFEFSASDGTLTSSIATITLEVQLRNEPPSIASEPKVYAEAGKVYRYRATGADPNGDVLSYALLEKPTGMTIDASTGQVDWVAPIVIPNDPFEVVVEVRDPYDLTGQQSFELVVQGPPMIVSTPPRVAYAGHPYVYSAGASDPNAEDVHTWSILSGPSMMSIDPSLGTLSWSQPQLGLHLVELEVKDQAGLYDRQVYVLEVRLDDTPPSLAVTVTPALVDASDPVSISIIATDQTQVSSVTAKVNGQSVTLSGTSPKTGSYTPSAPGVYLLEVTAVDSSDNTRVVHRLFSARDPEDETEPTAALDLEEDLEVLMPTDIIGSVADHNLLRYTLKLISRADGGERVLGEGTTAVTDGLLGTLDPTVLENGLYTVVLEAEDINGAVTTASTPVRVEGQAKVGLFTLSFVDLSIPVSGIPITVTRTYDSRVKGKRDFGIGWSLSVKQGSFSHNRMPGDGWYIHESPPPPPLTPCVIAEETKTHYTEVRLSDREVYRFAPNLVSPYAAFGACYAQWHWTQTGGRPGATLQVIGHSEVVTSGDQLLSSANFAQWDPRDVRLTTPEGMVVDLDRFTGIERIEDRNGNELWFLNNGIVHSSGKGLSFVRDGQGRITRITDPMGYQLHYVYDEAGDLVAFIDQTGARTEYVYDQNHYLEDIVNPLGVRAVRNTYDASGRLVAVTDASGRTSSIQHDLVSRREILTDRLGHTRYLDYDEAGHVVQEVYPGLGPSGAYAIISRTFNAYGDVLTETNELGHTTTRTYDDRSNLLTETNPLGETSTRTYDLYSRLLTETDPRGFTTTYTNDASGNRASEDRKGEHLYTFTYDGAGNLTYACDPRGFCDRSLYDLNGFRVKSWDKNGTPTVYTYDARGLVLTETTTRSVGGQVESLVTSHVYDAAGRETDTVYPDGSTWHVRYDAAGRESVRTDPLGQTTTTEYTDSGQRARVIHSDGTTESWTYDAEDRVLSWTDREGRTWRNEYDARGRMVSSDFGGTRRTWTYDAAGRRTSSTDARGHTTQSVYDAAGRLTEVVDALGYVTARTYDTGGNLVSVTDAKDRTTSYTVDAHGRVTRIDYPDERYETTAFDAEGNVTSRTDREGRTTEYTHDGAGNLLSVTNAEEETWTFAYDELGQMVAQTDPKGHTTSFGYDGMGRETSRQFHIDDAQTRSYDASGALTSMTNYSGATTTYEHDADGHLVRRTHPDQSSVTMTWTSAGQRRSATDARGTTWWSYTPEGHLESVVDPMGRSLGYTWDAAGNLGSRTAVVGSAMWTEAFGYDARGQLVTVTSAGPTGLDTYALSYDETGQLESIEYPNGVTTTYTHDALDRVASITVRDASEAVLASWSYTREGGDSITRIVEADGTTYDYAYDLADRLIEETLTSSSAALVHVIVYSYDDAGNRSAVLYTPSGQSPEVTACSHDARDRISQCGGDDFTWDEDGRLVSREGAEGYVLTWDSEDRLLEVDYASGAVAEHGYDADGHRVWEVFTPNGESPETTEYLVDLVRDLAHDVADVQGGQVAARYVRAGDLLLGLVRGAEAKYFHADHLGSVRALTDVSGDVTDVYRYAPFGELRGHEGEDPQRYRFAGEKHGPEGRLSYNRARWMDPSLGVFGSIDPFLGLPSHPQTLQRYGYVHSNPVGFADPSGRIEVSITAFGYTASIQLTLLSVASAGLSAYSLYDFAKDPSAEKAAWAVGTTIGLGLLGRVKIVKQLVSGAVRLVARGKGALSNVMSAARLRTTQTRVSGPKIEKYREMIRDGVKFDPIKVDGDIIVDGNHRYIASELEGVAIDVVQWTKPGSAKAISWAEVIVDDVFY